MVTVLVRELIIELLGRPMDAECYVGKGMGPLDGITAQHGYVIFTPEPVIPDGV